MDIYLLSFLGIVVGSIFLTVYNYLWKLLSDPNLAFDLKYWITMLVAVLLTIMSTPLLFLNVQIPAGSDFYVFITMVAYGFTVNQVINKPISYLVKTAGGMTGAH
ncbi:hypothetical protein KAU30_04495 [Candidatus Bathyarchaeota archaeon]|nr:hypothetical protein [Candidatus Bathyarchaeota archaeon]